jgi:hypothetical protein
MDTVVDGALRLAAITMGKVGEETSTMMGILVEEEKVKTHITAVAHSVIAITKAKARVMISEVEVTTTRAMVGDEHSITKPYVTRERAGDLTRSRSGRMCSKLVVEFTLGY